MYIYIYIYIYICCYSCVRATIPSSSIFVATQTNNGSLRICYTELNLDRYDNVPPMFFVISNELVPFEFLTSLGISRHLNALCVNVCIHFVYTEQQQTKTTTHKHNKKHTNTNGTTPSIKNENAKTNTTCFQPTTDCVSGIYSFDLYDECE